MKHIVCVSFCIAAFFAGIAQSNWVKTEELIITNPPFNECHASTIVELSRRQVMVAFFAGTHESNKDVCIWLTQTRNNKWDKPSVVADGIINDTLRFPCWNPVLFRSNKGRLFLFYKIGPNPREWWGMVKTSMNEGKTWSKPEKLPAGILGPIKNKPVQLADGTILCPSSIETESVWKVRMEKYSEANNTWITSYVDSASPFKVIQPAILTYANNKLLLVCRSDQNKIVSAWSNDNGNSWGKFFKLDLPNPNSGIDAVTLQSGVQLLVYNPATPGKKWFNSREKLYAAISKDGINWTDISVLENGIDGSNDEFSYPAVIQSGDGTVHITYTYKRKNIKHVMLRMQAK